LLRVEQGRIVDLDHEGKGEAARAMAWRRSIFLS
jgi:hypothetical protein